MKKIVLYWGMCFAMALTLISSMSYAQNLIDSSNWTVGSSVPSGFGNHGNSWENAREMGLDFQGNNVVLWVAKPDSGGGPSGGFNTNLYTVDHIKGYRFALWVKRTHSDQGATIIGAGSNTNGIKRLNGTIEPDSYFIIGNLPQVNKWYLLVGYVHGSNYNSTENFGGIYDGVTGQKVQSLTDFKMSDQATSLRMRAYLHNVTNTLQRQYFHAPRLEAITGDEPSVQELLGLSDSGNNILNTSSWTVGCGSVSGFGAIGSSGEDCREIGKNHVGQDVVLWKATPDASSTGPDGGWNTGWHFADHTVTHRFSVWIKKTNSNSGSTYSGFYSNNDSSLRLNGDYTGNPYFFSTDLPKLNRWYLLVGYVHKSSHTGTTNTGRIYDGVTGEEVGTLVDFKFKNTMTQIRQRAYLYYDGNTSDRQYFWNPRVDRIDGTEPTINELLLVNEDSKLIISHDLAGNRSQVFYCDDPAYCSPTTSKKKDDEDVASNEEKEEEEAVEEVVPEIEGLVAYPNPTRGMLTLAINKELLSQVHSIKIYNTNSLVIKNLSAQKKERVNIDLSNLSTGIYFLHIQIAGGKSITKKIIKK